MEDIHQTCLRGFGEVCSCVLLYAKAMKIALCQPLYLDLVWAGGSASAS